MPTARGTRSLHGMFRSACVLAACVLAACVLAACVLAACGLLALGPAWAQPSGVDETSGPAAPPDNSQGEIVPPGPPPATVVPAPVIAASAQAAPTVAAPTFPAPVPPAPTLATPAQTVSPPGQPPASPQLPPTTAVQQAPPVPLRLDQPRVIDTARLTAGDNSVSLFGIVGLPGESAQGLQGFLAASGNRVSCQAQPGGDFVCLLPDGTDVAAVALINGAARARADAPAAYREQEAAAQAARRGLWSSLPPPPVTLNHPTVKDTATLVAERQSYVLDGLQGLGAPYAGQLQGYVAANGDALICQQQPVSNAYICILKGGTDIAKVALVNGAALVSPDAPDFIPSAAAGGAEQPARLLAASAGRCRSGGADDHRAAQSLLRVCRRRRWRRRYRLCRRCADRHHRRGDGVPGLRRRSWVGLLRPLASLARRTGPLSRAS